MQRNRHDEKGSGFTDHRLPPTDHRSPITDHRLLITAHPCLTACPTSQSGGRHAGRDHRSPPHHIIASLHHCFIAPYGNICFYNKRNTAEIDFILNKEIAIEVKSKAIEPDMQKLKKLSESIGLKRHFILSKTPSELPNVVYPWFL